MSSDVHALGSEPARRDLLKLVTLATAAIGTGAVAWAFIDSMDPAADVIAAGAPIEVDLSRVSPGQQIIILWRGSPILIINRTPDALKTLQSPAMVQRLSDPNSEAMQQPPYAVNWHRSVNPEYGVMVGICTHLGCLPGYYPQPSKDTPVADWPGGYFCPCHGSKYDLAGRVYSGVPAPYNLPVPPYTFPNPKTLRIGENPAGATFELSAVVQM
ncbi:MAG TPA: ubiquinol-cytochrome c reductase iron-sulfur subunit [Acetobacteraceae bacterium]|nr:ubiquinol-cytochrome c reductase iron-sulfur subunit [Acetobacteraceae bacterium]